MIESIYKGNKGALGCLGGVLGVGLAVSVSVLMLDL